MARSIYLSLVCIAAVSASFSPNAFAQSQTPTPSAPASTTSPILNPKSQDNAVPATNAPKRSRAISSEVAAALAAASPKYTPPPPKPEPKPEEELPDMREIDKPKNTIVRLPKMVVREPRPAVLTERSVHTDKGLADIAMRRYISDADRALNRFTLPLFGTSMEARALAMYAEDERLKNMADLQGNAIDAAKSDPEAGEYIRKEAQKTYLRSSDYGWSSGPPK
jgi:hypothetical protein